jgi:hypothetical protein
MSETKHSRCAPPLGAAPVDGFPGYYVTRDGHAWSTNAWRGSFLRRLATFPDKDGYPRVRLIAPDGSRVQRRVHRLVAAAFLPAPPATRCEVRHLDGVPSHCAADNLAWGTGTQNADDRERHGRTYSGERHHSARLNAEKVRAIRREHEAGVSTAALASEHGVSMEAIRQVVMRETWRRVS